MHPVLELGWHSSPSLMQRKWKVPYNAQFLSSQSGKFALAPAGLKDERALGWHGEHWEEGWVVREGGGGYIFLSCLAWSRWALPTSAVHFSPAASRRAVQNWPVCWWITWTNTCSPSSSFACHKWLTLPWLKAFTWVPQNGPGVQLKKDEGVWGLVVVELD